MRPIYMLGTVMLICFAVLGAAGTMFMFNDGEDTEPREERTTEELAAELDEALGVHPPVEEEISEDNTSSSVEEQSEESRPDKDSQTASGKREEPLTASLDRQASSPPEEDNPSSDMVESEAISLGPENESISVDKLLQMIEE
ncbi:hypothetical protein [Salibacterium sp. K-3]